METAVILATYNSENYIRKQIDSLLSQTYKNFVIYIHDDGSTDKTVNILKDYKDRFSNRINILTYPRTGSAKANFISLLHYVSEDYVFFCDHDDVWLSNKMEITVSCIKKMEHNASHKAILAFTDAKVVDDNLDIIAESFMEYTGLKSHNTSFNKLLVRNNALGCTIAMNKNLYSIVAKCPNSNNIKMHDNFSMLIASAIGEIIYIDKKTLLYRQHETNQVGANKDLHKRDKIRHNIMEIMSGGFMSEKRKWIDDMRLQASELAKIDDLPKNIANLCYELSVIGNKNKIERILFYRKNRIERDKDNWWLILFC